MSRKTKSELSMSIQSVSRETKKTKRMLMQRQALLAQLPQAKVASSSSGSPLETLYETDEFRLQRDNNVRFQIAEQLLWLRRTREMSQEAVGKAMGTSQSAIARIEGAEENVTVDTIERLVKALKGRFQVSIQPEELPRQLIRRWWETGTSFANWNVTGMWGRQTNETTMDVLVSFRGTLSTQITEQRLLTTTEPT
jgi:hypothetical protein